MKAEDLVKGQWYYHNTNGNEYILKVDRVESNIFYTSEYFFNKTYYKQKTEGLVHFNTHFKLADIFEIQEYLPLDHPDRITIITNTEYLINFLKEYGIH